MLQKIDSWTARHSQLAAALMVLGGAVTFLMVILGVDAVSVGTGLTLVVFALLARFTGRRFMRAWPMVAFVAVVLLEVPNLKNLETFSILSVLLCALAVILVLAPKRPQPDSVKQGGI